MAWESGPKLTVPGFSAGADLRTHQYKFVEISGAGAVGLCNAATDAPFGVLQNKPNTGEAAEVLAFGVSKVSSDAALAAGVLIGTSADGQADAKTPGTDITEYVVGRIIVASGAAGGLAVATINCLNPHRAV